MQKGGVATWDLIVQSNGVTIHFNFWWGCQKIAPGCKFCYADAFDKRVEGTDGNRHWGERPRRYIAGTEKMLKKLDRDVAAGKTDKRLVFVNDMSDFFEEFDGPVVDNIGRRLATFGGGYREAMPGDDFCYATIDDLRRDAFRVMDECPNLIFILLTKRPENIQEMWAEKEPYHDRQHRKVWERKPLSNVWLGCSVSEQETADRNIPELLKCRDLCDKLFVSYEPALGPVDWNVVPTHEGNRGVLFVGDEGGHEYVGAPRGFIDWIICGGESGANARACNTQWIRDTVAQCQSAGVACFVKQLGSQPLIDYYHEDDIFREWALSFGRNEIWRCDHGNYSVTDPRVDGQPPPRSVLAFKTTHKKGGDPNEWPDDLRVRQWPQSTVLT